MRTVRCTAPAATVAASVIALVIGVTGGTGLSAAQVPQKQPSPAPPQKWETPQWDWSVLDKTPAIYPAPKELDRTSLRAVFYEGLPWKGKPTKVFAWIGVPPHAPGKKVPGVVFIHGGGGTASDGAVKLWMSRGYAAISMDTTGSYPGRNMEQHPEGGPRGNGENFAQIDQPIPDQWYYHAVADVALANTLLRSLPDVDANRVGLTGLSWGGVLASTVAGVDNRFRWVAPVYGCGFMDESEYFKPVVKAFHGDKWMALWDPSQYLSRAKMPMLWINGTNDDYFQLGMWQKSLRRAPGPHTISLKLRMPHSGGDGERPNEIYAFAESVVNGGEPLPRVTTVNRRDAFVSAAFAGNDPLAKAEIAFTTDTGKWSKRHWETQPAFVAVKGKTQTVTGSLPAGTTTWYARVEDGKGRSVTTDFEELASPLPAPLPLPGGTVYVAPQGSDENPGTTGKPVASLFRAREIARNQPRTAPVNVVLKGGTYYLPAPLELTKADSGTETAPVTWKVAPGEKAIISGGTPITGWQTTQVNGHTAWRVVLPDVKSGAWYFRTLYGGTGTQANHRTRARMPNSGFFEVESVEKRGPKENNDWLSGRDRFFYNGDDLAPVAAAPDKAGTEVVFLTQWCESHLPVVDIDPVTHLATFGKFTIQNFGSKNRYWVENTRAALDVPGEWTLNRETGELLYLPLPGETPRNTTLIAPHIPTLVRLKETSNVTFRNLTFSHNEWWFPADYRADGYNQDKVWAMQQGASSVPGAIQGDQNTNMTIEDCEITHIGSYGIVLSGAARNNHITHTNFTDLGAGGIRLGPSGINKDKIAEEVAIGNTISDCRIVGSGHLFTGAVGIWLGHTQKSQVVHNEIADAYYTGISGGWVWGFGDLQPSQDNYIGWNHIHDLGKNTLGDGAGIYMLGRQTGTVIEGNVVHDMNGNYASRGIYLDDGSSDMTIKNNLSYRNRTANYFQWRSKNNRVENNVFAFGEGSQIELAGAVFNDGAPAMNFTRNIIVVAPGPLFNAFNPKDVKNIYTFDKNLVWRPDGKPGFPDNARTAGWDANLLTADPRFVSLDRFDFRLRPDSPALTQLGFVPVDWSQAGPRAQGNTDRRATR